MTSAAEIPVLAEPRQLITCLQGGNARQPFRLATRQPSGFHLIANAQVSDIAQQMSEPGARDVRVLTVDAPNCRAAAYTKSGNGNLPRRSKAARQLASSAARRLIPNIAGP
jgi:hypothetical protein